MPKLYQTFSKAFDTTKKTDLTLSGHVASKD